MSQYPTFNDAPLSARDTDPIERSRALHTLARHATDTSDLATLMDMLGLTADDVHPAPAPAPAPTPEPRAHAVQKRFRRGTTRLS